MCSIWPMYDIVLNLHVCTSFLTQYDSVTFYSYLDSLRFVTHKFEAICMK